MICNRCFPVVVLMPLDLFWDLRYAYLEAQQQKFHSTIDQVLLGVASRPSYQEYLRSLLTSSANLSGCLDQWSLKTPVFIPAIPPAPSPPPISEMAIRQHVLIIVWLILQFINSCDFASLFQYERVVVSSTPPNPTANVTRRLCTLLFPTGTLHFLAFLFSAIS